MAIHEGFTSIHQASLVDHVSREPQRVAGLVGAPLDADALNRPNSVIDGAFVGLIPSLSETTNGHVALTHRPRQGCP